MSDAKYPMSREQGDSTIDIVKQILGLVFIKVANDDEDMHHNTDLYIASPEGGIIRFAMRMRTTEYLNERYKNEFTLCCHRHYGGDAEYQKIMGTGKGKKHYGDYMIYGFQDTSGKVILFWVIIDLNKFREWRINIDPVLEFVHTSKTDKYKGDIKLKGKTIGHCLPVKRTDSQTGEKYNDYFYAFNWHEMPGVVVADSDHWKEGAIYDIQAAINRE